MLARANLVVVGLAREKWKSSGISDAQATKLQLQPMSGDETAGLGERYYPVGALKIPYFDLSGKPTEFYRIRYLEPLPGFAGATEKPQRYAQPKGSLNEVYFPPLLDKSWKEIATDTEVHVCITEGELKAAAGCAAGVAVLGLGGVDVWRSSKRGLEMLTGMTSVKWKGRRVTIIYDSDAATNPNVVRAQRQLARTLVDKGALVTIAALPPTKAGKKQGLDDFLVSEGKDALIRVIDDAPVFAEADALWEMSEEVLFVREPPLVIERGSGVRMTPDSFVRSVYANRHYIETTFKSTKDGGVVPIQKKKPLAPHWLTWPGRYDVRSITYEPGKIQLIDGQYNTWPGWGVEPVKGDVGPWLWLIEFLFKNDPKQIPWFISWLAYPLQHPGAKLYTSALLWGNNKGTGKTALLYAMMKIYGKNAIEVKSRDLRGGFNSWAENRQFVVGDEITGNDARVDADWLKGLITETHVRINAKYMPEYVVEDHINYSFSSNHPDALFLEAGDRRYFIHEVEAVPAGREKYEEYDQWLHGAGPSALFRYLLDYKLGEWNPRERAPDTEAKHNMLVASKSDIGAWVTELREDPVRVLKPLGEAVAKGCDLFTPTQLLFCLDPNSSKRYTPTGIGRELQRGGFRAVNGGGPVRSKSGVLRLYAIRNYAERWRQASPKSLAEHYDRFFGPDGSSKLT